MIKIVNQNTANVFDKLYSDGYDKKYPSTDLVRLESWYFKNKSGLSLDYGCGPGTNGLHLLDSGYKVIFADISKEALNIVEKKIKQRSNDIIDNGSVCLIDSNSDKLPFDDNYFDYIVALSVLGNLDSKESLIQLLKEFNRVIAPGGKIILDINANDTSYVEEAEKNIDDQIFLTKPSQHIDSDPIKMFFPNSIEEFTAIVNTCDFIIEDVGYSNFKYKDCKSHEFIVCAKKGVN